MHVASEHLRIALALAVVASAIACKVAPSTGTSAVVDDLAQIEAELQRSEARLDAAGVVVAYREPASRVADGTPAKEKPTAAPPPDEPVTEPVTPAEPGPSEPEPSEPSEPSEPPPRDVAPSTAPDSMDSPLLGVGSTEDDALAPRVERETSARRDRSRSHRKDRVRPRVGKKAPTRCERVCELSETTCDLQDRICDLAAEHADDVRYEDACQRAEDQCEAATRSCESCAA
ncbi:MAG TPA: hypothetical protein VFG69_21755 [Nannocystaceae bacterium]|nr:hypothetical protein [Nannocystaceae bacterium]